jgi:protein-arginine kinase activator protein McsA
LLHRYTTEHAVEYVIVAFFIWGTTDIFFRLLSYPREMLALKHDWLPARNGREPVTHAGQLLKCVQSKPSWLQESRIGQRLAQALSFLQERGSSDDFGDYLRQLAEADEERTHANFALVRFIGWVAPVLGFLGTVLHFGTALGGLSVDDMSERLPAVVGEMGTAFNTTTAALTASVTMMFCLFLCERTERGIVHAVDRRTAKELLNRFEQADANLLPFISAVEAASDVWVRTMDKTIARQLEIWSKALEGLAQQVEERQSRQLKAWESHLERLQQRYEVGDAEREKRFKRIVEAIENQRSEHRGELRSTVEQMKAVQNDFARLVETLTSTLKDEGRLVELQATLADNLRLLRETKQIDEAVHGLTAAIHLLTARSVATRDHKAA